MEVRAETLAIAGVKTHLLRSGQGEPVILLHGLGNSSYSWRHILPALASRFEVIAPDLPGFGRSDKPWDFDYSLSGFHSWLLQLMETLGVQRARFVGSSLGGLVTLWTAMEAPQRVERMALLSTPAFVEDRPRLLAPFSWPLLGRLCEAMLGVTCLRLSSLQVFVDKSRITAEMIAEYAIALSSAQGRRAAAEVIRRGIPRDYRERVARYSRLHQPALVLVGDSDIMVTRHSAERLARSLPASRLFVIERCGHASQEDAPERITPLLADFLG